jgi:hypothetical protein
MSTAVGAARPAGALGLEVVRRAPTNRELTFGEIAQFGRPQRGLPDEVNLWRAGNQKHLRRGLAKIMPARAMKIPHFYGALFLEVLRGGRSVYLGLASLRVVTTVGVKFICDDFNNNTQDVTTMKFHGFGTATSPAEGASDTTLGTELTTQYATDNTRPTGSQASATVSANATYTTVATLSPDANVAITEHGIFSQASNAGGTLLDRSLFSAVNLVGSADSLQATYVLTMNSGG